MIPVYGTKHMILNLISIHSTEVSSLGIVSTTVQKRKTVSAEEEGTENRARRNTQWQEIAFTERQNYML